MVRAVSAHSESGPCPASQNLPNPEGAWLFDTADGSQYFGAKSHKRLAWAVHGGPVVPIC